MDSPKKESKIKSRSDRQFDLYTDDIAALIKAGSVKNVVICAGAGISTSAGIPDFRSPKTGLYHNLKRLNLDYPEQVFDINFFRRRPEAFYQLAHELYPGKFVPTKTHCFIRLLHRKGILLRCFTQNIDTLERQAGLPADMIVEAHGSFASSHCIGGSCGLEADYEQTRLTILNKEIPRCRTCHQLVKPDIVFFGEGLPKRFFERMEKDMPRADLLIVMGTSLQVQPFASLPEMVSLDCPRLLINLEEVGDFTRDLDVTRLIETDRGCMELAQQCGWEKELSELDEDIKQRNSHSDSGEDVVVEEPPTDQVTTTLSTRQSDQACRGVITKPDTLGVDKLSHSLEDTYL